eukprot:748896-Hanusia_phi.AAC.1
MRPLPSECSFLPNVRSQQSVEYATRATNVFKVLNVNEMSDKGMEARRCRYKEQVAKFKIRNENVL